jgi:hypothetical protein
MRPRAKMADKHVTKCCSEDRGSKPSASSLEPAINRGKQTTEIILPAPSYAHASPSHLVCIGSVAIGHHTGRLSPRHDSLGRGTPLVDGRERGGALHTLLRGVKGGGAQTPFSVMREGVEDLTRGA